MDSIEINSALLAFILLSLFLFLGKWIRLQIPIFQKFFIPSSLIAGFIGLIINQQYFGYNIISEDVIKVWELLPKILITIIFASLFIGKKISTPKQIWKIARPQIIFGQTIAWGQYVIGFIVTLLILVPFFNGNILSAPLIEMSFQGGIGVPAGLGDTFKELGYSEGQEIGLLLATFGILTGLISGIILVNWGVRSNKLNYANTPNSLTKYQLKGIYKKDETKTIGLTTRAHSVETISLHIAFILLAVGVGYLISKGLLLVEQISWGTHYQVIKYIPLFPLAMIGGVIVQLLLKFLGLRYMINRKMIIHIQNMTLDFLIVAAIANLSISTLGNHTATFVILAIVGFLWNLFSLLVIAPRIMTTFWFERGIVDYGQSMGMTMTGLLLLQVVDPDKKTPTFESFGYKQLLFEPFVGGGIVTSTALPLTATLGPYVMLMITGSLFVGWLSLGFYYKHKGKTNKS